jgi:hypothetical protein
MKIGIIGAGHIGGTLALLWAQSGHSIMISSRHPDSLDLLVKRMGKNSSRGDVQRTAEFGKAVLLAIPLGQIAEIEEQIAPALNGKTVLDAMNPFIDRDGRIAEDIIRRDIASGRATQQRFPSARIVRAFSSIRYSDLQAQAHRQPPLLAVPFASDDQRAKEIAAQLITSAGFYPFDIGSLDDSRPLDPGGTLFGRAFNANEISWHLQLKKAA